MLYLVKPHNGGYMVIAMCRPITPDHEEFLRKEGYLDMYGLEELRKANR